LYCWEAAKNSQAAITELLLYRKSTGVILAKPLLPYKGFALMAHLKTAKCECLWSSAEHRAEAVNCRGKNIFILKEKSSNLYIIMFYVSENVSEYIFMHSALICVRKCFILTGGLKSGKCERLW